MPITRFAPSPTGALHIGGARTALFNWLFARANGGKFLLRIEDTDLERSSTQHESDILRGLAWLGLDWDDAPIKQSTRQARHAEVALQMLANGTAYKCFATQDEIDAHRAENPKDPFISPWRDTPAEKHPTAPYAIRLRAPQQGTIEIADAVQKTTRWQAAEFNDLVLLRSDGTPTYMLAVVVDDFDMGITHIIRGDDHFINAGRQRLIYDAMGWACPTFAHIPLIHGHDGKKLSKRHGATALLDYARAGYTPEGLRNTLTRLGWSHGNEELFTSAQAIKWFNLSGLSRSPARFDDKKLEHINAHHIKISAADTLIKDLTDYAELTDLAITAPQIQSLTPALPFLRERAKTLAVVLDNARFALISRPVKPAPMYSVMDTEMNSEMKDTLTALTPILNSANFTREDLMQDVKAFAQTRQIKMNAIAEALRVALSGKATGPSVFDMLCFLGREESLARINDCLDE